MRIVHQIWMQGESRCPKTVRELSAQPWGPNVKYILWDWIKITRLIEKEYKEWAPMWYTLPSLIITCDVARAFILHKHGGVYADIDYEPSILHNQVWDLQGDVIVGGYQSVGWDIIPNNAWIFSQPKAAFWIDSFLPRVKQQITNPYWIDIFLTSMIGNWWTVVSTAGPVAWWRLESEKLVDKLPFDLVYNKFGVHARFKTDEWHNKSILLKHITISIILLFFATCGFLDWLSWFFS
jgi:hypothetical protein